MKHRQDYDSDDEEFDDEEDFYSDMSRERDPYESDEDYEDRQQDLDDLVDYFND